MHIHVVGICGTFMGSLALLVRAQGHRVTGSDANVYPPMSTLLEEQGIALMDGFSAENLQPTPDLVVIGNAMKRGNPEVEAVLNQRLRYISGPQLLRETVLGKRTVLAVAGTHGKTTTVSMLSWILEYAGLNPGFLIGGVPGNFDVSARLGDETAPFVVEADEYDSAFFDKRSKFVHYRPDVAVLNNLEFDHADIFDNLAAIERQFHHMVRTIPQQGNVLVASGVPSLKRVIEMGVWTPVAYFGSDEGADWRVIPQSHDGRRFQLMSPKGESVDIQWELSGRHNQHNALAAAAAAHAVGVPLVTVGEALERFKTPRRRQEIRGVVNRITVIDDFAHHPTAITQTLEGLRAQDDNGRLLAVIEPRSNTMKLGTMQATLAVSVESADLAYWYQPQGLDWSIAQAVEQGNTPSQVFDSIDALVNTLVDTAVPEDRIVVMSNGSFEGIHERLIQALQAKYGA
ncbi:UDP-N-acetylmuramate--L-alanyl-gamma-D-glutamyl-meso-2,6-diaminoheptandioate ligase [Halomonadaceae bacterium LMG 33818]|uniref:UDP-N-acetylmuramate:L-alanyl-gamma-D-glutamyl- meso-diaminopimelate ligase n=1 Tax=Cernens ardua TaxID=3402176 RepID=UPI003EDBE06B